MNLRPIGTCEHLWSEWLPDQFRPLGGAVAQNRFHRVCELCNGHQFAFTYDEMREREQAAITAPLRPARRA